MKSFFMKLGAFITGIFLILEIAGGISVGLGGLRVMDMGRTSIVVFSPRPQQEFLGTLQVITIPVKIDTNSLQQTFSVFDNGTQVFSGQPQNGLLYITDPTSLRSLSDKGYLNLNLKIELAVGQDEFKVEQIGRVSSEGFFTTTPPIPFRVILPSKITGYSYPEFTSGRDGTVAINVESNSNHLAMWYAVQNDGRADFLDYRDTVTQAVIPKTKKTSLEMRIPAFTKENGKPHPVATDKIHLVGGVVDGTGAEMPFEQNLVVVQIDRDHIRFAPLVNPPKFSSPTVRPSDLPNFAQEPFSTNWQAPKEGELDAMGIAEIIITSILFVMAFLILHKIFSAILHR